MKVYLSIHHKTITHIVRSVISTSIILDLKYQVGEKNSDYSKLKMMAIAIQFYDLVLRLEACEIFSRAVIIAPQEMHGSHQWLLLLKKDFALKIKL